MKPAPFPPEVRDALLALPRRNRKLSRALDREVVEGATRIDVAYAIATGRYNEAADFCRAIAANNQRPAAIAE